MGVPLAGDFDVAVTKPVDSRMVVTNYSDLNNILNRYQGLTCYVTSDKNLYVFQGSNTWEKVVTTNVDNPSTIVSTTFDITEIHNGQVIYVNNANLVTATLVGSFSIGFNVTIVQMGNGSVLINGGVAGTLRNRLNLNRTAGPYAVASILKIGNTSDFLLYGDLV